MLKKYVSPYSSIIIFFILIIGSGIPGVYAQQDTLWTKTYGGSGWDEGHSVQECSDGGFIIAGETESFSPGEYDVYLIRTDKNGDTLWTKTYGGPDWDRGYSVQECSDGGFIIAGETGGCFDCGSSTVDVYLIRTDENGDTLWTKTYGGTEGDGSFSVEECSDGGFIIAGGTRSFGSGKADVYLIRTDKNGDTLWTKTYGGPERDEAYSVQECSDGGFIITGETKSFDADSVDVYLIRTDKNGDTLWTKTYGGPKYDGGYSVQECSDGGFIIAGETESWGYYVYLIRTDENGDTLWTKTYGKGIDNTGYSVQKCKSGGFIIAGKESSFDEWDDIYLIRTDENGDTLWTKTYGGSDPDRGWSVQECSDGGFIVVGGTMSFGAGGYDVYLIRIKPEQGIEEDIEKDVKFFLNAYDILKNEVKIRYSLPKKMKVNISIYNSLAQKITTIVNGTENKGYHTVYWDAKKFSRGIYFIKFKAEGYKEIKKIILLDMN